MKKIIGIMVVAILLAGCSSKKMSDDEAKALLIGSVENIAIVNADIDLSITDENDAVSTVDMKLRDAGDIEKMSALMVISGMGMELRYYVKEGHMYMEGFGMKMKSKLDSSSMDDIIDLDDMIDDFSDIDDAHFERLKVVDKGNVVVYRLDITEADLEEFGMTEGFIEYTVDKASKQLVRLEMDVKEDTGVKTVGAFDFTATSVIEFPDFSDFVEFEF